MQEVNRVPTIPIEIIPTQRKWGYNSSIANWNGRRLMSYRHHPTPSHWRTELCIVADGVTLPVTPPERYLKHSCEDARFFEFNGKLHLSVTISRSRVSGQSVNPSVTGYGELSENGKNWQLLNWTEPKHIENSWSHCCKNLMLFEYDKKLHCTFRTSPNHVVLELDAGGNVSRSWKTPAPTCSFGEYRGGSQMFPFDGEWLRFVHMNRVNKKSDSWWHYSLGCIVLESKPPFRILKVSSQPILTGTEEYVPGCAHYKPRCILPYGATSDGDGWTVSVGIQDAKCGLVRLKREDLNL